LEVDRRRASRKLPQKSPQSIGRTEVKAAFGSNPFVATRATATGGAREEEHERRKSRQRSLGIGAGVRGRVRRNKAERANGCRQ
jgi:hypothetical protein